MIRIPVAYIRRSTADAGNPGDVSREVQEEAVKALAHRDGHNGDVRLFVDWARSADEEKELRRTAFRDMLAAVERGEVSIIYAYSLDRLARSTNTFARLLKAAKDRNVRVVTQREGDLSDTGNPTSWAFGFLVSFFAEFELRMAKARAAAVAERRTARGDHFGKAPYGFRLVRESGGRVTFVRDPRQPLEAVLDAVRGSGSILGAARRLEAAKIPAPYGGKAWSTASLVKIIERHAPELLPRRGPSGRRQPTSKMLAQLVKCHCGQVMTPKPGGLYCYRGQKAGAPVHGPFGVSERKLLPWIKSTAERFAPKGMAPRGTDTAGRRAALMEQRERLGWAVTDGLLTREKAADKAAEIDKALEALEAVQDAVQVPERVDWDRWDHAAINTYLRTIWDHVQLGPDMQPVIVDWRIPAEYLS
jgi:DNA invertase Pin-like site-specific DNA recombinase